MPSPPGTTLTDVVVHIRPCHCSAAETALALDQLGPALLDSLRTHLQAGPERRAQERVPFLQTVEVSPVLEGRLGESYSCQARDISLGGLGLSLLSLPLVPPKLLVVSLPRPSELPLVVPAQVARLTETGDGRYAVGLRFGLPS
jgi:hypothetical protein